MKQSALSRERVVWTALVAALATSASWLALISLALVARQAGIVTPEWLAAGRALVRVAWLLFRGAVPAALLAAFVSGVIALAWAQRREAQVGEDARHA